MGSIESRLRMLEDRAREIGCRWRHAAYRIVGDPGRTDDGAPPTCLHCGAGLIVYDIVDPYAEEGFQDVEDPCTL